MTVLRSPLRSPPRSPLYSLASAGFGGNLSDAQILAEYNADLAYLQAVGAA